MKTKKKPAPKKPKSKAKPKKKPAAAAPKKAKRVVAPKWAKYVEQHGIVLASAQGPIPSVAEAVAGEPIVGSWWAHPKSQAIFDALSEIDDSPDVRCFKLVDGKVTFVHKRLWPALVRLVRDGVFTADRAASVQQEHAPTGEHHNIVTPFPDWVPDDVALLADKLTTAKARNALGVWA